VIVSVKYRGFFIAIFLGDEMLERGHWENTDVHPFSTRKSFPDLVQAFLKKWWLNQILKLQTSSFLYGSKVPAITITVFITILEQNSCQSSTKPSENASIIMIS
jgi:hypothetical protein